MRLLLVEDDAGQRFTLTKFLQREEFDVDSCSEQSEAVRLLKQERFEICVLDLQLEDQNGIDLLRQLDESVFRETCFIIHTGHGTFDSARDALNLGVFAFVEKLSDPAELIHSVHRAASHRMRQSLTKAEEEISFQLRMLDCVQQAVIATGISKSVVYWNRFSETMYGWSSDEACGQDILDLIFTQESRTTGEEIRQHVRAGQVWSGEVVVRHRNGRCFPIDVTVSPIFDALGKKIGNVSVANDITERKQAERAIQENEARFQLLLVSLEEVVWSATPDGHITYLSQAVEVIYGRSREECLADKDFWIKAVLPADRVIAEKSNSQLFEEGQAEAEYRIRQPNGNVRWLLDRKYLIRDGQDLLSIAGIATDITRRKDLEVRLRRVDRLASLGSMAAGIAHEINNPIAAAWVAAETAKTFKNKPDSSGLLDESLDSICTSVQRCQQIIENVLRFAREESSKKDLHSLNKIVQQAVQATAYYALNNGARISTEIDNGMPQVLLNPTEIEQVFVNVIRNAIEAGEETCVSIRTELRDSVVCVVIQDNGAGIDEDNIDNVFDPFFSQKQKFIGTGLGLAIAHRIIEDHQGHIEVVSVANQGTTFTVSLPISPPRGI